MSDISVDAVPYFFSTTAGGKLTVAYRTFRYRATSKWGHVVVTIASRQRRIGCCKHDRGSISESAWSESPQACVAHQRARIVIIQFAPGQKIDRGQRRMVLNPEYDKKELTNKSHQIEMLLAE